MCCKTEVNITFPIKRNGISNRERKKSFIWVIYQVIKIYCSVADLCSILWCRCKYCVHVYCRPLWVEYPQDLATFALEDEYLIGETHNQIWGLQYSSSIHSDNCSLSLKDPPEWSGIKGLLWVAFNRFFYRNLAELRLPYVQKCNDP